jgi:hypothetical protein
MPSIKVIIALAAFASSAKSGVSEQASQAEPTHLHGTSSPYETHGNSLLLIALIHCGQLAPGPSRCRRGCFLTMSNIVSQPGKGGG